MFEYTVSQNTFGRGVVVAVQLSPVHHGATYHKPLALTLLDVLNDDPFRANHQNAKFGSQIGVRFNAPKNGEATHIIGTFVLSEADDHEIQIIAGQAQRFLSRRLTEAVDAFQMVLAVATVDPYKARLRSYLARYHHAELGRPTGEHVS